MPAKSKALLALVGMTVFYFGTLTLLGGGWAFTWSQFGRYWYLVVPIIATFAAQVYLSSRLPVATGATSTVSMAACCAHHVADLIPLVGLVSAAPFLTRYQVPIMTAALLFNLATLAYMKGKTNPTLPRN